MSEHLTPYQWQQGESGNPQGRPPKLKSLLRSYGLTPSQATELINALLLHDRPALRAIVDDEASPVIETIVARALLKSAERGTLHALDLLLTRAHGLPRPSEPATPTEPIQVTLNLNK